jgi:hypothetical protein
VNGRESLIHAFLTRAGCGAARREKLVGDASFRRYERVFLDGETRILMDAPPPRENVLPFVKVATLLRDMDLTAPRVHASDPEHGLLLLEDLGDMTLTRALALGHDERELYFLATDALIHLHRQAGQAEQAMLPAHDEERCLREVALVLDWYWPAALGEAPSPSLRDSFAEAWRAVLPHRYAVPSTIALFDFHIDNLMVIPEATGVAACGLLDFQDAVRAPLVFDLASLLEDVRRDVPQALKQGVIAHYLRHFPSLSPDDFALAYTVIAAQRTVRIAGTFARLLVRDGKPAYQSFMPRVWRLLAGQLTHPALAPLDAWFTEHLPAEARRSLA